MKSKGNKQKQPQPQKQRKPKAKGGKQSEMMSYHRMIADPCGAPFAAPPYLGVETGYFIRVVDNLNINAITVSTGVVGNDVKVDAVMQFTPGAFNSSGTALLTSGGAVGGTLAMNTNVVTNFVSGSQVSGFRCVAHCIRFVPTGNYAYRSGIIGIGYSPNPIYNSSSSTSVNRMLTLCADRRGIGEGVHEIKWLPADADQIFTPYSSTAVEGGTTFIVLGNASATYATTTTASLNGYFELTTVYEWQPNGTSSDISVSLKAPPSFTVNQHQSSIKNIAEFLTTPSGMDAMKSFGTILTAGVKGVRRAAAAMPMLLQY